MTLSIKRVYKVSMNDYSQTAASSPNPVFMLVFFAIYFVVALTLTIALWKVYRKAGKPGWAIFIPIYSFIVLLQIAKRPGWWVLLFFIPLINLVFIIIAYLDLAKAFGRSTLFGIIFIVLLSPIGFLILGFGKSQYVFAQTPTPKSPTPPQSPPPQETPPAQKPPDSIA